jgi:hypothetical protein
MPGGRHRHAVLLVWICLLLDGGVGTSEVGSLLSNRFTVPGSPSQNGLNLLRQKLHQRAGGAFTLVAQSRGRPLNLLAIRAASTAERPS